MKRMVLVAIGLLFIAGSAFAQPYPGLPDTAYVGLFTDAAHSASRVNYSGVSPTPFQWYIFFLPSKTGFQAAEFKIQLPANVLSTTILAKDAAITVELGTLTGGISTALAEGTCRTDWFYLYKIQSILMSNVESQVELVENPNILPFPAYEVASCELGYPIEPLKRYCHLSMNYDGGVGVQSKSWGAIKSLFQ
jgi:hypothetical protein